MNDQTGQWMTKISSDSKMRIKMMDMMIAKTKDDQGEMMKLVISILNNPEMNKMILATNTSKAKSENISIEPLGIVKEDIKVGKMNGAQPIPNKK